MKPFKTLGQRVISGQVKLEHGSAVLHTPMEWVNMDVLVVLDSDMDSMRTQVKDIFGSAVIRIPKYWNGEKAFAILEA